MVKPVRKTSSKNPPILSHEFIIQNHADIVSCIAMIFVVGLMFQATAPFASIFISLQHNVTEAGEVPLYTQGIKDWGSVGFYSLICVVIHAIIQEYGLDKISKKLHLSKSKLAIFSTSGQLAIFYLTSTVWGLDISIKEHYVLDISRLWADYPAPMTFLAKLYIIIQMAYSLHELPELYFQRVKREEIVEKAVASTASLILVAVPYFLNFNRLLVCLLVLHHISELVFHIAQLIQTIDKEEKFSKLTKFISNGLQVLVRLGSIILAVLTLWYGLAKAENQTLDIENRHFNTPTVRLGLLAGILLLQMYLVFNVASKEMAKSRESKSLTTVAKNKTQKKEKSKKTKKGAIEESDLPEVDQNTNKTLRKQKVK